MPSKNPRVSMTFDPASLYILSKLAVENKTSVAGLAKELIFEALELREDVALSKLAAFRNTEQETYSHKEAWKKDYFLLHSKK